MASTIPSSLADVAIQALLLKQQVFSADVGVTKFNKAAVTEVHYVKNCETDEKCRDPTHNMK